MNVLELVKPQKQLIFLLRQYNSIITILQHIYTALSTAFNELGRKDEALIAEQKASELKPGGALFYYYRGKDALFKGNNADALTAFKKATALIENTDHSKEIINFINILFSPEERVWIKKLVVLNDDISRTNDELKEINKDQVEYKEVIS